MKPAASSARLFLRRLSPLAALLLLWLQLLAAAPSLHAAIHDSEGCHADACAVALLSSGQVDSADALSLISLPSSVLSAPCFRLREVATQELFLSHAGRGPPSTL